jgi:hypothetical protein
LLLATCVCVPLLLQRLVPGTRWVDLETDRGKPARLSSAFAAAAEAASKELQQQQEQPGAGDLQQPHQPPKQRQTPPQQHPDGRRVGPLDSVSDHLAELEDYPLGSLGSFASWDDVHDNVPEWIRDFTPDVLGPDGGGGGATSARLTGADSHIVGGNYLSHEQMHAIEQVLVEGSENEHYKPFCNSMWQQLQASPGSSSSSSPTELPRPPLSPAEATSVISVGSSSARPSADGLALSWELKDQQPDDATRQQLAVWAISEQRSWAVKAAKMAGRRGRAAAPPGSAPTTAAAAAGLGPGSSQSFCDVMAEKAQDQQQRQEAAAGAGRGREQQQQPEPLPQEEQWGQEHKRRTMQKLLDLEDSVLARDGDNTEYKPFCESMFQSL